MPIFPQNRIHHDNRLKLGLLPRKFHPRTLQLHRYLTAALPAPRGYENWQNAVGEQWGMMLNSDIGDCAWAAAGHAIMEWTANAGTLYTPPDADILWGYESTGYNPSDPSTDQGTIMTQMMAYWQATGISGHRIAAWMEFDFENRVHFKQAIELFGSAMIGVVLTQTDMNNTTAGLPWFPTTDTNVIGGHAVVVVGYGATGVWVVTWGQLQYVSWTWIEQNCQEAYGCATPDWIQARGVSPSGFNINQLEQDLTNLDPNHL